MKELLNKKDVENIRTMPKEIFKIVSDILKILDIEYGSERDKYIDCGGYIIIIEKEEDFEKLKDDTYIDYRDIIPEYVDIIVCSDGEIYTNSLIICNNDYAISLIIPFELTPQNLRNYIIE